MNRMRRRAMAPFYLLDIAFLYTSKTQELLDGFVAILLPWILFGLWQAKEYEIVPSTAVFDVIDFLGKLLIFLF